MANPTGSVAVPLAPDLFRRIVRLQIVTIAWMTIEVAVALGAAWIAKSPALLGFGGDSAVELLSALVVLWRFRSISASAEEAERLAARVAGGLLFTVAAFVVISSGLSLLGYREPQPSFIGIVLLIVAAIGMPWLARQKRKLATQTASASLQADATESALCGYLSLAARSLFRAKRRSVCLLRTGNPKRKYTLIPTGSPGEPSAPLPTSRESLRITSQ